MEVEFDALDVLFAIRGIKGLTDGQLQDALKEAMTTLAYRARKAERDNARKRLDRPTPFTIQSFAAVTGKQVGSAVESKVFVLSRMSSILERLEVGGQLPKGLGIADTAILNRYGSIGKKGIQRLLKANPQMFVATIKRTHGIFEREETGPSSGPRNKRGQGRKFRPLRLVLAFEAPVNYRPMLHFHDTARAVGQTFGNEVRKQVNKRIKDAMTR